MNSNLLDAKILIIDDQIANLEVLEELLILKGYTEIKSCTDSRDTENIIKEFKPDLLLLDLMMPYMNGFDVMKNLKEKGLFNANMPILVLTADITIEAKKRALSEGASDFITKPFNLTEVELRIKNLLFTVYLISQLQNQNENLDKKVKERTAQLSLINESITKQNKLLKEIAWIQSHLVRAPLARIMGLSTLLLDEDEDVINSNKNQIINYIVDSANELDVIIKDIVDKAHLAEVLEREN
jgi:two-component system sensor histidine kinase/response regulator